MVVVIILQNMAWAGVSPPSGISRDELIAQERKVLEGLLVPAAGNTLPGPHKESETLTGINTVVEQPNDSMTAILGAPVGSAEEQGLLAGRDTVSGVKARKLKQPFRGTGFQTVTHMVGSHAAIVTRPVTAVKRLFFFVYDTLRDAVGWPAVSANAGRTISLVEGSTAMDLEAWERRLDEMTGSETSFGSLKLMIDGEEFFPRLFAEILGARESVKIRTYIFDNDDFALQVADLLKERSMDVDVRVLTDGLGTIVATGVNPETIPVGHEAPRSVREYLTSDSKVRVRQQPNTWTAGDHSKMIIIDGKKAFVGGMNFGREYRYEWHDLMVEVDGPVVNHIDRDFTKAWASGGALGDIEGFFALFKGNRRTENASGYPVRVLRTRPGDYEIRNTQLEAIRRSGDYIYIQNPYFTDDRVLDELVRAARRGVNVRVVLPHETDNGVVNRSNVLAANRMLRNGVRVYLLPRMSHLKAAVYDGWACFGSANFDKLSFRVNYEFNLATSHEPVVRELVDRLFTPDFEAAVELTEELPEKTGDYLLELVADQL